MISKFVIVLELFENENENDDPVIGQEQPQQAFVFERRETPPPTFSLVAAQAAKIGGLALDRASFECAQKVFLGREL